MILALIYYFYKLFRHFFFHVYAKYLFLGRRTQETRDYVFRLGDMFVCTAAAVAIHYPSPVPSITLVHGTHIALFTVQILYHGPLTSFSKTLTSYFYLAENNTITIYIIPTHIGIVAEMQFIVRGFSALLRFIFNWNVVSRDDPVIS